MDQSKKKIDPTLEDAFEDGKLILDEEEPEWWTCPYHRNHIMPWTSLIPHLGKCQASRTFDKPALVFVGATHLLQSLVEKCMADATHVVPYGFLNAHLQKCHRKAESDRIERGRGAVVAAITSSQGGDPNTRTNVIADGVYHTQCRGCHADIEFASPQCAVCFMNFPQSLTARTRTLVYVLANTTIPVTEVKKEESKDDTVPVVPSSDTLQDDSRDPKRRRLSEDLRALRSERERAYESPRLRDDADRQPRREHESTIEGALRASRDRSERADDSPRLRNSADRRPSREHGSRIEDALRAPRDGIERAYDSPRQRDYADRIPILEYERRSEEALRLRRDEREKAYDIRRSDEYERRNEASRAGRDERAYDSPRRRDHADLRSSRDHEGSSWGSSWRGNEGSGWGSSWGEHSGPRTINRSSSADQPMRAGGDDRKRRAESPRLATSGSDLRQWLPRDATTSPLIAASTGDASPLLPPAELPLLSSSSSVLPSFVSRSSINARPSSDAAPSSPPPAPAAAPTPTPTPTPLAHVEPSKPASTSAADSTVNEGAEETQFWWD